MKLGEYLVENGLIHQDELEKALEIQRTTGGRLGDILLATTSMRAQKYYHALAGYYHIEFIDLMYAPINLNLLQEAEKELYLSKELLPIKQKNNIMVVATANPSNEQFEFIKEYWGPETEIMCCTRFDILSILQNHYKHEYVEDAVNKLVVNKYELSSRVIFCTWQRIFFILSLILFVFFATFSPQKFLMAVNILLMLSIEGILLYKIALSIVAIAIKSKQQKSMGKLVISNENLPIYSVLIPLFQEKEVTLRHLFANIEKINYPKDKLDVKILLEEDDTETIKTIKKLNLPRYYEFVYVPRSFPQTKAKACNYGLQFALGKYLTLYDAEDKPDPDQIRMAVETFIQDKEGKLACIQCHLNFYNIYDNWLTVMFTIEYMYWFDLLLPALEYFDTPIPLGGTSNHFKTQLLQELNAWDPYNVSEDADLGIRLTRLGYKSKVIPSTTYEEANCRLINWIKQRTRWMKGYMQTYLVHMRNPYTLWRTLGTRGFWGFHLFIGGTILTNLANLILWVIFIISIFMSSSKINFLFPGTIIYIAQLNFYVGSFLMVILNILGALQRQIFSPKLLLYALTAPIYWFLMSIASYRACYQLIFKPSHWEKTEHGISATLN